MELVVHAAAPAEQVRVVHGALRTATSNPFAINFLLSDSLYSVTGNRHMPSSRPTCGPCACSPPTPGFGPLVLLRRGTTPARPARTTSSLSQFMATYLASSR